MKRWQALLAAMLISGVAISSPGPAGDSHQASLTSTLDFAFGAASELPSARLLAELVGTPNAVGLQLIALGIDETRPPGVRLRALASLASYPSPEARDAMRTMLDGYAAAQALAPTEIWLVRAALEVLAISGDQGDVLRMTYWLEREDARDLRARAAWALGRLGDPAGIEPLRKRFLREAVGQVAYQITQALDRLSE